MFPGLIDMRHNQTYLHMKLNGYSDKDTKEVWSSCVSMYCTCVLYGCHLILNNQYNMILKENIQYWYKFCILLYHLISNVLLLLLFRKKKILD
jgi:hypothetical protein